MVTKYKIHMFNEARIKLTAWYLVIIMFISLLFSLIIYRDLSNEVDRFARSQRTRFINVMVSDRIERLVPPPIYIDEALIKETKERIIIMLFVLNGGILILSGVAGYFLAGRTLKPIKKMVDEQNRFVSDSSHELRTPLTSLKSSLEVALRDKKLTLTEAKTLLNENLEDVNRLQTLSDNLLKLSSGKSIDLEKSEVSTKKIIIQAIKNTQKIALKKNIEIKSKLSTGTTVYGKAEELIELFTILLDNAIKYSSEGSEVSISAKKHKKSISISVEDSGMGISDEDKKHIFDRFYRSDLARSHKDAGGFGLGLSIAKKIINSHGGTITVDSKIGSGTIFTVSLPLHIQEIFSNKQ